MREIYGFCISSELLDKLDRFATDNFPTPAVFISAFITIMLDRKFKKSELIEIIETYESFVVSKDDIKN